MFNERIKLIENLTGVHSSKLNYYVELKKRNEKIIKQNNRLEIINQLVRDINIDMTVKDIIKRVYSKLPLAIPCDFLGLALTRNDELYMKAILPAELKGNSRIPRNSFLWNCFKDGKASIFDNVNQNDVFYNGESEPAGRDISLAVAPLFIKGTAQGILLVGSCLRSAYTMSELNFVQQLSDQLAICILNTMLYKQVTRAKSEWETTFNAVTEPIVLIDRCFNILRSNNRFPTDMDIDEEDEKNMKCYKRIWGRDKKCDDCMMDETIRTEKPAYKRVQTDTGKIFDIFYYPVFNEQNQIAGIIHHVKDVTLKTKMEVQLMQSAKLAAIGEMAAGVAHELNNPMTVIIGTAQLMQREIGQGDPKSDFLNDIINCGLRCKKIVQNLLTFSRQDEYPFAPTDLNVEIERVLSLISYQINKTEIKIVQNLFPDLPKINANGHQIQQVLINFLLNARDALEGLDREKIIEVSTSVREADCGKKWLLLTVKDNGIGIEQDNLSKIFNPFYTSKSAIKGTGLGLSVSLGIAEAHEGTIEVDSVLGEGSSFSLVLPVDADNCL
ncbi:ATP-binding protein [Pelotomaculum propionicicum]|uniref:ATP-binding protein n=1 Tax=Pelotomaculum propionicicum TaxID=258475 RepID=UPI003B7DBC41